MSMSVSTGSQYYPVMPRLDLGIHEYPARAQLLAERAVVGTAMSATKLVDGKAKPCHDGVFGASSAFTVP
jgi:hypothetical protein